MRDLAPGSAAVATKTLPRDSLSFTVRGDELGRLMEALTPRGP
jgi:hypothetical protein